MKKLILLLSLFLTISCSSNDEDKDTQGTFNYPSWIQGTWKDDASGAILSFTKNDIKYNLSGKTYSFTKNQTGSSLNQTGSSLNQNNPQQIAKTDHLYIVDLNQGIDGLIIRFNFVKNSDSKMESKGHLPGSYTKQ